MTEIFVPVCYCDALISIKEALTDVSELFWEVRVFGSCARSSVMAMSDIDILVITKEKISDRVIREKIHELITNAVESYGVETDVVFYSLDSYLSDTSEFTERIRKESKGLIRGKYYGL